MRRYESCVFSHHFTNVFLFFLFTCAVICSIHDYVRTFGYYLLMNMLVVCMFHLLFFLLSVFCSRCNCYWCWMCLLQFFFWWLVEVRGVVGHVFLFVLECGLHSSENYSYAHNSAIFYVIACLCVL